MITSYRGFTIEQLGPTDFYIMQLRNHHGSYWSAKCYIDEFLSP